MTTINVTDAGPIEGVFSIDLSPGPGVYELRGARGTGKTTIISSIDWLANHKVNVTLHDGAVSGKVEGFGVVAPIGGRKRRKGEMDLDTIDAEKFSLTDLVDPPGKTAEVRDAHCIKALAVLSEAKADPRLYYDLAGGKVAYDELGIAITVDPVLLATRIKRALDELARQKQAVAGAKAIEAIPLERVPDGLDMNEECDLAVLSDIRDGARDILQGMRIDRSRGMQAEEEALKAEETLATITEEYKGPTVEKAGEAVKVAVEHAIEASQDVQDLEEQLAEARMRLNEREHENELALQAEATAKQHHEAVSALLATTSFTRAYCSEQEISDAQEDVDDATIAYDRGIRVHDVKQNQARAREYRESQKAYERAANELRNKAGQVFDVLAKSLHTAHLQIKSVDGSPRIFVQHPRRGLCAFDRDNGLSDGERVDYTLRELIPHIESPGMLPIPQRVWQDLQPADRKRLHALAVEKSLYLFGAQVDDGELRVEFMGECRSHD